LTRAFFIGFLLVISSGLFSQEILVVENKRSLKNFKYYTGDELIFKGTFDEKKVHDLIMDFKDSSIIFESSGEVRFSEITAIYRVNYVVKIMQPFTLLGGVAYFGVDAFNRAINNDAPVILGETVAISAGLVAFSFAMTPFRLVKYNTMDKWKMRMIDLGEFGSEDLKRHAGK
jgi:hypothetical protein